MNQLVPILTFVLLLYGSSGSPATRVVGGIEALPGEVPSIVALLHDSFDTHIYTFRCAGTLIYPHIVVTAAQCFDYIFLDPTDWRARVGSVLHSSDGVLIRAVGIRLHPDFDMAALENDIALVNLGGPVNVIHVAPALLPSTSTMPESGAYVQIAGWGATSATSPITVSSILHVANVRVLDRDTCVTNLQMVDFVVRDNHLCTVGSGAGICHNDIGSPLYHRGQLVGIASFHIGCGFDVFPAVYTAIAPHLTWIQDNVLGS